VNGARRLVLSGVALTALLAVVALASRGHRPGGGTGGGGGHVPELVGEYIGVMMLALMLLLVVLVGFGLASDRRRRVLEGETNWRRTLVGVGILAAALLLAVGSSNRLHLNTARPPTPPTPVTSSKSGKDQRARLKQQAKRPGDAGWLTALILASITLGVAVAAGLAARHSRRHGGELEAEAALAQALDEVLADTLDDLRAERDPRKAVIEVYARMEQTFAAYRVPRDPAETPLEYVARALDSLRISASAVRRLTLLYERAKFSTHVVDTGMKDDAIGTLAGLRAELEFNEAEAKEAAA
jgi:Domain of unknown function (DUF4129)